MNAMKEGLLAADFADYPDLIGVTRIIRGVADSLRMLMTQLAPKLGDHSVHLILQMELLFFQLDFLKVVVLRHMVPIVQLCETPFVLFVFLDQTAKFWVRGNQVLLDLLLLHHHHAPPIRMETLTLRPP
jgi:hypothetical protein